MKRCSITDAHPTKGSKIHRRGLAKKKGGIGQHVTKVVTRTFTPNLRTKRIWVSELKKFVTVKLTALEDCPSGLLTRTVQVPASPALLIW